MKTAADAEEEIISRAFDALAGDMAFALDTRGAVLDGTHPRCVITRRIEINGTPRVMTVTVEMINA